MGQTLEPRRIATFGGEACPAIGPYPLEGATRLDAELLLLCNALRVQRARPDAEALVRQLDVGLTKLREQGAIMRVFERMGLFEPRVADWQVLGNN